MSYKNNGLNCKIMTLMKKIKFYVISVLNGNSSHLEK